MSIQIVSVVRILKICHHDTHRLEKTHSKYTSNNVFEKMTDQGVSKHYLMTFVMKISDDISLLSRLLSKFNLFTGLAEKWVKDFTQFRAINRSEQ